MRITRIEEFRCKLGEGPVWDVRDQALYGTDVLGRKVWRYDPAHAEYDTWSFPDLVSALALRETGGALLARHSGLYLFDFNTGAETLLADVCAHDVKLQLNDGKTDRAGRFLVGSVNTSGVVGNASLYRVDPDLSVATLDSGFIVTNGPCCSPDGSVFYFADTIRNEIYAYDYDSHSGAVAHRRLLASAATLGGMVDGATVDAEGCIWSALCGGSKVVRYRPDGSIALVIDLPTPLISSVMFGGPDLDRLFVTSIDGAAAAREIEIAAANPTPSDESSGAVFVIDGLGICGVPEQRFRG